MADQELRIKIRVDKQTGNLTAIDSEFNKVTDTTKKADTAVQNYTDRLKNIVSGVAGIYAIKKAWDVATSSISALLGTAGEFEKFESVLTTLEGSSKKSQASFSWIKEFAAKTPYLLTGVTDAFVKLRSYGIDPMDGTLKALGDTSAAMGKPLMQAVEAMADAVVGENERLKQFGIRASVEGEKIAYSWSDASGKAKYIVIDNNSQIIQSTLNAIFNSKYQDAMQNMMSTWNGLTSNMEDNWTSFKNTVALQSGLFVGAKEGVKAFNEQFLEMTKNKELMNSLGNTVFKTAEGITSAAIAVAYPIRGIAYIVKTVEVAFSQLADQSGYAFEAIKSGAYSAQKGLDSLNPFSSAAERIDLEQKISKAQLSMEEYTRSFKSKDSEWKKFVNDTELSAEALTKIKDAFSSAKAKMLDYQNATKQTNDEIVKQKDDVKGAIDGVYSSSSKKLNDEYKKALEETKKFNDEQFALWAQNSEKSIRQLDSLIDYKEIETNAKNAIANMESSYLSYYEAIGDESSAFYLKEEIAMNKLKELGILSNAQMLEIRAKDNEKFQDEQFKKNNEWLYNYFDNMNKALDNELLDGFRTKFKNFGDWLENLFGAVGDSILASLSRSFAGSITSSLQSSVVGAMQSNYARGVATLATGAAVSASEIGALMNAGGIFDSATNSIKTSGGSIISLGADGSGTVKSTGSDLLGIASTISSLKTAYDVLSGGISGTLLNGFNSIAGFTGVGSIAEFGAGFANPFAYAGMEGLPAAMTYGSLASAGLLGGGIGYGVGSLGDKLFGANTYAGVGGASLGAIGGMIAGPLGIAVGSVLGSVIGGIFGKKTVTDTGYNFLSDATANNIDVMGYSDWKKKSWFSSSKGSTPIALEASELKQIDAVFNTYDYLLAQLGDADKIWLDAGKYSKLTFQDALAKNFITAFTDISQGSIQAVTKTITDYSNEYLETITTTTDKWVANAQFDAIYQTWVDYAESVDKTVLEAISDSVSTYISTARDFEKWSLERDGKTLESLQKQSQWAQADFENLANMIGATGVSVENFTTLYQEAIKNSFDADTISKWQQLGTALRGATDAGDAFKNAVISQLQSQLSAWTSALGSIQGAIDNLSPTFKTLEELKNSTINLDNYSTLLSDLEKTRQNEINTLTTASQLRITQLNNEKTLFTSLADYIDELNLKFLGTNNLTADYFFNELDKAKSTFASGGIVNTSKLTGSANTYLDSALQKSTSQLEYFREVAKVREGIGSLGGMVTGGTLDSIELAIKTEEQTLASKLDELNLTALAILQGWKGTATSNISTIAGQINTVQTVDPSITAAYENILGRAPEEAGGTYWQSLLNTGTLDATNITSSIATAAIQELYSTVLGRVADKAGLEYWTNVVQSGTIDPNKLDELFKEAAQAEINGSHAGGLKRVPFDGYIAELHEGERVQTSAEAKRDDVLLLLIEKIEDLTKTMVSKKADDIRLRQLFERLSPDGDALQTRDVA